MNSKQLALNFGIWIFVYPIVTTILYLIRAYGASLPVPVQTLIATLIIVLLMLNLIGPFVKSRLEQLSARKQDGSVPSCAR